MIVEKKTLLQYLYIGMMLHTSRSCLYVLQHNALVYIFFGMCVLTTICYRRVRNQNLYFFFGVIGITLMITRVVRGGYGLQYWLEFIVPIWLAYIAYALDKESFLIRFVKAVVFLATISLFFWIVSFISPELVNSLLIIDMPNVFGGTKGVVLYSFHYSSWRKGYYRNCGIFTEPGIYQIVLNAALFILLFFNKSCKGITIKKRNKYLAILSVTLLSSQSTTGYAGMAVILIGYMLGRKEKTKKKILTIIAIAIGYLISEYVVMKDNSMIYQTLIAKLMGENGKIDLSVNTGYYRMLAIDTSWKIFIQYPLLGAGDLFSQLQTSIIGNSANAGGGFLKFLSVEGLVSFIPVFYMYAIKAKKRMQNWIPLLVHLFLWLNTSFAQAEIIYSCIIMFAFVELSENQNSINPEQISI